jgi:microsomal epoxide hydrolase
MADVFAALMTDLLGYGRFAAQGGDWGGYIAGRLGYAHAEKLHGIHLNFLPVHRDMPGADPGYQKEMEHWQAEEAGYSTIQGTKPQTLAYALTDSPVGLAAWIVEKFHTWTDGDGDIERAIGFDSLLANVTLYWATAAIGSSFWPYYAVRHGPWAIPRGERVETPTAHASFPREIRHPTRAIAEQVFNIQRWTEMPRGGHFAALEVPDLLAPDVAEFFRSFRQ